MKTFYTVLLLEHRRIFSRRNIIILILFLLLCLYFIQAGVHHYKTIIQDKEKFLETERIKTDLYINYAIYGSYGFRLLFVPSPLSILFVNSTVISELSSNVDVASLLSIYKFYKGRNLFAEKTGGFMDFSGIILLFGTLMVLYLGFETFLNKDYIRFLASFVHFKKLFFSVVGTRLILLIIYFFLLVISSIIVIGINQVRLLQNEYRHLNYYLLVMVLTLIFFFILGTVAGAIKSRFAGFLMVIIVWFVFIFLIPGIIRSIISSSAENITSSYHLELEKLQAHMGFESRAIKKAGIIEESMENTQLEKDLMESYLENEFKAIQKLEKDMENEMKKNIDQFQKLSLIVPSGFYLSVSNEISSKGYKSFIYFFSYLQKLKKEFVRFYINKRFYSNYEKVELFIKGEENIFYSLNVLPDYFVLGVILTVFYIIFLFIFSYYWFKKSLMI